MKRARADFIPASPSVAGVPELWGYDFDNSLVYAWDKTGQRIITSTWPDSNDPRQFVEGPDGFIHSLHNAGVIKRWKPKNGVTVSPTTVAMFSESGWFLDNPFDQDRIAIDRQGRVYFQAMGPADERLKVTRLVTPGYTFADEAEAPRMQDDYVHVRDDPPCEYKATKVTDLSRQGRQLMRSFAVVSSGRWVCYSPIDWIVRIGTGSTSRSEFSGQVGADIGLPGPNDPNEVDNTCGEPPDFLSETWRMWGDAWYERAGQGAGAWVGVINTGFNTQTFGATALRDVTNTLVHDTSFMDTRKVQYANVLPALKFSQKAGSRDSSDVAVIDVPWQKIIAWEVDGANIYVLLQGANDSSGIYQRGGIYKAAIPGGGQAPGPWTKIQTEPDHSLTPKKRWGDLAVTRSYIWVSEVNETNLMTTLARFNKDGVGRADVEVIVNTQRILHLQAGWNARWK